MTKPTSTPMRAWIAQQPVPVDAIDQPSEIAKCITLDSVPMPEPATGEVLIKVSRGTLNPNDLYHLQGRYSSTRDIPFPRPLGFEGAGVVVKSGGGPLGRIRVGRRVAFYSSGLFGEYVLCKAIDLIDIPKAVSFENAASSVANPMTALMMLRQAKASGAKVIINTAAASALGRLLLKCAGSEGIAMICIVRRDEQAAICNELGALHVLNSSDDDFDEQLSAVIKSTGCRLAYDCTAGDMPARLLSALPDDGVVRQYGYLTPGPIELPPQALFPARTFTTFEVETYLAQQNLLIKGKTALKIASGMADTFKSTVQKTFTLEQAPEAYAFYSQNMTGGKVQIVADPELR